MTIKMPNSKWSNNLGRKPKRPNYEKVEPLKIFFLNYFSEDNNELMDSNF